MKIHAITYKKQIEENLRNSNQATQNVLEDLKEENEKNKVLVKDLEKFKLAVDNVSDQIIITDQDATVLYINKATEKISGYTKTDVVGQKAGKLWGNIMERSFYENLWKTIKVDKKPFVGTIRNKRKNNQVYVAAINISPILDDADEIIFFVGIERDITEEKEVEEKRIKQLTHELEVEAKEKEFISMASHQLLTPLSLVMGYIAMLISGKLGKVDDEARSYLKESLNGGQRMSNLVKLLLTTSRLESGHIKIIGVNFDLDKVMQSVISELKPKLEGKKLTIELPLPKKLMVFADQEQTRAVLTNVLDNAIKYTEKGIIAITVSNTDSLGIVCIKDSGIGINQKDLPHIFEKFYSSQNWLQRQNQSYGLGLYVATLLLKLMDGTITVESKVGKGSTFTISLPLSKNV